MASSIHVRISSGKSLCREVKDEIEDVIPDWYHWHMWACVATAVSLFSTLAFIIGACSNTDS